MEKQAYYLIVIFIFSLGGVQAQDLTVATGGSITIPAGEVIYVLGNLAVDASGTLTLQSDATKSASIIVSGTATGNIVYNRYVVDANWHLISAPVTTQTIDNTYLSNAANSFDVNGGSTKYAVAPYNNAISSGPHWEYAAKPYVGSTTFTSAKGYAMKRTTAGTFTFTGEMADTDVSINITNGNQNWNLIGNPYPSSLPVNTAANATNILSQNSAKLDAANQAIYVWNGTIYAHIIAGDASRFLAPGQAFFVNAVNTGTQSFLFSKSLQSHQSGTVVFNKVKAESNPSLVLTLTDGISTKDTQINYLINATTGLNPGFDIGAFNGDVATFSLNSKLVLDDDGRNLDFTRQAIPVDYENLVVPLSVTAPANANLTFRASTSNFPLGVNVYLEDRLSNTYQQIDNTINYSLNLTNAIQGSDRFFIHTSAYSTLAIENLAVDKIMMFAINKQLNIKGLPIGISNVQMFDLLGRNIFNAQVKDVRNTVINLPLNIKTGIYIIHLKNDTGIISKKIFIQ